MINPITFARTFGVYELLRKPLRMAFAPLIIPRLKPRQIEGENYLYHRYNTTWANERCIEIPIVKALLEGTRSHNDSILEVGNVLSHYQEIDHTVVDKYEQGHNIINTDIMDYVPAHKYDIIVSISTLEHIGFDCGESYNPNKIQATLELLHSWLSSKGSIIFSVPLRYNPTMDRLIAMNVLKCSLYYYYERVGFTEWNRCTKEIAFSHRYGLLYPYANSIMIGKWKE